MGCATSKQKRRRPSAVPRSYSTQCKGDKYHLVALTSSSIKLQIGDPHVEAKAWIPTITPRTPTRTPPGEPETINIWELMEGLEDAAPDEPPKPCFQQPLIEQVKEGEKLVVYLTSLRGVRKTYEDCCDVRRILKGYGVRVDERDVSMHSGFREELRELKGEGLPRVFMGETYIGGAEEIRRLHEDGKLIKILAPCNKDDGDGGGVCEGCGDVRFVPCESCCGSCKIYHDDIDEEEELEGEEEYGFQRCPHCNENGLIRCPICCC